jgi:hypothetical protein
MWSCKHYFLNLSCFVAEEYKVFFNGVPNTSQEVQLVVFKQITIKIMAPFQDVPLIENDLSSFFQSWLTDFTVNSIVELREFLS